MRIRSVAALSLTAAALSLGAGAARAAEDCEGPVTIGSCVVRDPNGSYTCTLGHVGVRFGVGTFAEGCLLEWQP
ncbi:MAG TPA: hypothetical protein VF519_02145 [Mycobacteriales bacterium]|jgi:hypothetical protein